MPTSMLRESIGEVDSRRNALEYSTMRRRGVVLRVLVVLGVAAVVLLGTLRWYLTSRSAADSVQQRLSEILQTPVRIGRVDLGLDEHSTFSDLQLFEVGDGSAGIPFLMSATVAVDASAWTLARGERPRNLTLNQFVLTLRFDSSGRLLTQLPRPSVGGTVPHIRLRSGTLILKQQDRPDFTVHGLEAELLSEDDAIRLTGDFNDPRWGQGKLTGRFESVLGTLDGAVQFGVVHLTSQDLENLPFVPAATWRQVRCEGDTSARIELSVNAREEIHYRVDLRPTQTRVHITSINLTADQALGRVLIEDAVVYLEGVEGKAARGSIAVGAVLDFREPTTKMQFNVNVARLDLQQLPRTWRLPPLVGGSLSGRAALHVSVADDGLPRTAGRGEGEIQGVSLLGFESRQPIRLRLTADGNGFHFDTLVGGRLPLPLPNLRPMGGGLLDKLP